MLSHSLLYCPPVQRADAHPRAREAWVFLGDADAVRTGDSPSCAPGDTQHHALGRGDEAGGRAAVCSGCWGG